ncbi:hypothetical protein C8Q76DRAFT_797512 [Earliella scabrosa]|nr:hypothetical protein C8Q76DRAFT_797512 [Earliella scabrosa]
MHSPIDRASPALSDESSSDSPEHEQEVEEIRNSLMEETAPFAQQYPGSGAGAGGSGGSSSSSAFGSFWGGGGGGSGASKRRMGPMYGGGSGARDAKSRRKDGRAGGGGGGGAGAGMWDQGSLSSTMRGQREDVVDSQLVDQLRNLFGDPFDETLVKNASKGN